jgi:hypothetical protein
MAAATAGNDPDRRDEDAGRTPGPGAGAGPEEDEVDEASEESFPASDAPASWSGPPEE